MNLFDTHFHFDSDKSPREYVAELPLEHTYKLMCVSGSLEDSFQSRDFAAEIAYAFYSVGVHPQTAETAPATLEQFAIFRDDPKLKAIGELGLDFYYENSTKKTQMKVFDRFLELALEWEKPAIVHCRDIDGCFHAYEECFAILKNFSSAGGRFVVHCFAGTPHYAERFLELGGYLGITGIVTFKKAENIRDIVPMIPLERLLLETDSPYLAPVPFRGKVNHPKYLPEIASAVAQLKAIPLRDLAEQTTENAKNFYRIETQIQS